jgi:hypothetical protein
MNMLQKFSVRWMSSRQQRNKSEVIYITGHPAAGSRENCWVAMLHTEYSKILEAGFITERKILICQNQY